MLLIFFAKVPHFSSHRPENNCRPLFLHKKRTIPQQTHLDAVMHFSRICRNFSTKHNELPLKLRKRFCNWVFSGEKIRKESLWKREIQLWQPCWYFLSKTHRFSFFKRFSSLFERKYQTVKFFFQKRNNLLEKTPLDRKNAFLQSVGDSSPKYDNFPRKSWKKRRNLPFFKKKECPSKHSFGHREAFLIIIPKNYKKTKTPLKIWRQLFIGFFLGRTCVSTKGPDGSAESSFDNCADVFLSKFDFVVKN